MRIALSLSSSRLRDEGMGQFIQSLQSVLHISPCIVASVSQSQQCPPLVLPSHYVIPMPSPRCRRAQTSFLLFNVASRHVVATAHSAQNIRIDAERTRNVSNDLTDCLPATSSSLLHIDCRGLYFIMPHISVSGQLICDVRVRLIESCYVVTSPHRPLSAHNYAPA